MGGHGGRGGPGWLGLFALPFILLGGLLLFRSRGGRWRWNQSWGHYGRRTPGQPNRDHDRPPPAHPGPEEPPYTGETHRF
jgi:hypothetical protein